MPSVYTLGTGWTHIRFNDDRDLGFPDDHCFVTLPPAFDEEVIPDRQIHSSVAREDDGAPQWYRGLVNRWWEGYRERTKAVSVAG